MGIFTWNSSFVVGVDMIDQQHRVLVSKIDLLYDALVSQERSLNIKQLLDDIVDYTNLHFRAEEELMIRSGYPELKDHLSRHHKFEQKIHIFQQQEQEGIKIEMDVFDYLQDWLIEHILVIDKKFADFVQKSKIDI
ncbi:MAG: hemerythrin family protein [Bdellovibrionales bacterium]|jgi:hemerythrin|nr:hemerythrin family protein [Bdellovibrionales bacterium]MBT3526448.1 hemerythrin family protein [Bdellovibrionales bacterium]MBT7668740.1 hemerythrin family protein [Bdellovibrionales bacterium]MBT7766232.1 hemerythrin family protein [Bdellovibrionales bacterium]